MSATPEPTFKTIGRLEHASTDLGKTAIAENASADLRKRIREASRTPKNCPRSASGHPKVALGVPRKRPGTPSEPPSDIPRSSPEPPKREYANQSRVSSFSTASREHLVQVVRPSPPRCRTTFTPFQLTPFSPTGPARSLPPRRTLGSADSERPAATCADPGVKLGH